MLRPGLTGQGRWHADLMSDRRGAVFSARAVVETVVERGRTNRTRSQCAGSRLRVVLT